MRACMSEMLWDAVCETKYQTRSVVGEAACQQDSPRVNDSSVFYPNQEHRAQVFRILSDPSSHTHLHLKAERDSQQNNQ